MGQLFYDFFSEVAGPGLRFRRWPLFLLLALGMAYLTFRLLVFPETVLQEEHLVDKDFRRGFAVQQPRFDSWLNTDGTVVHLWFGYGRLIEHIYWKSPKLRLQNLHRHEWLARNQAILLNLGVEEDLGSYTMPQQRLVFFDFRSGDLRTCTSSDPPGPTECADILSYAQNLR